MSGVKKGDVITIGESRFQILAVDKRRSLPYYVMNIDTGQCDSISKERLRRLTNE